MNSIIWLLLTFGISSGVQEGPKQGPFEVLVKAAIEEAGHSRAFLDGTPVFLDLPSFEEGFQKLYEEDLLSVQEGQVKLGAVGGQAINKELESVRESYGSRGRTLFRIRDGGIHLELKKVEAYEDGFKARIVSRKHTPEHFPASLCPREVIFTVSPQKDGNWRVTNIFVDVIC